MPGILKVITNGIHYESYKSAMLPQSPEKRNEGALIGGYDIRYVHLAILVNMLFIIKSY